ncbi:MAG: 23S rRNA (uracil(1939)-C(5))-methyltransferase RlmD [Candidatus Peregrinibacteria bacterium]
MAFPLCKGKDYTGVIEKIVFGGMGMLRWKTEEFSEGFVIFVKGGLPGQTVLFRITKQKKNYAEGKIVEILKPSPLEEKSEYEQCPGCAYQNLPYSSQIGVKQGQMAEVFRQFSEIKILDILPSPQTFRYRNKMEFSCGYEKMWVEDNENGERIYHDEGFALGFHPEGSWAMVKRIGDALIASEKVNALREMVEEILKNSGEAPWNPKIFTGFWRGVIFRESHYTGEIMINFVVSAARPPEFWEPVIAPLVMGDMGSVISGIIQTVHTGQSDAITDPQTTLLWGSETFIERLGTVEFEISPFSFFQTNTLGAEVLYGAVQKMANLSGGETVLDLFCGTGSIGIFLSSQSKKIRGIEMVEEAVEMAKKNAERNGIHNAEFFAGKVETLLPELFANGDIPELDLLIIDPPRTGLHPKALSFIAENIDATKMIYISCNPPTLARDMAFLEDHGWKALQVQPVDMFPHTPHIECIAELVKK